MKSRNVLVCFLGLLFGAGFAEAREQHAAHVHGTAKLNIAVEGKTATVELESPAMDVYGFEHAAKGAKQIKTRDDAVAKLKSEAGQLLMFDPKLACVVEAGKVDPFVHEGHGEHGELRAQFTVKCAGELAGSTLKIGFWKVFPKMQSIEVQVVGDKSQGAGKLSRKNDSIKL